MHWQWVDNFTCKYKHKVEAAQFPSDLRALQGPRKSRRVALYILSLRVNQEIGLQTFDRGSITYEV